MSLWRYRTLDAITHVRRTCADVMTLADLIIFGSKGDSEAAMRLLPNRIRTLQFRAQRALTALESENTTG
jgi:hypothetical protein